MTSHSCVVPSPSQLNTKIPIYPTVEENSGLLFALWQKFVQGAVTSSFLFIHVGSCSGEGDGCHSVIGVSSCQPMEGC